MIVGAATISRAAIGPDLPLENNDETAHTFIDLPLFHRALRAGTLLQINLGANFGAPLLRDPVVCPFAPHALTYALVPPATAMLVNKLAPYATATIRGVALSACVALAWLIVRVRLA